MQQELYRGVIGVPLPQISIQEEPQQQNQLSASAPSRQQQQQQQQQLNDEVLDCIIFIFSCTD